MDYNALIGSLGRCYDLLDRTYACYYAGNMSIMEFAYTLFKIESLIDEIMLLC